MNLHRYQIILTFVFLAFCISSCTVAEVIIQGQKIRSAIVQEYGASGSLEIAFFESPQTGSSIKIAWQRPQQLRCEDPDLEEKALALASLAYENYSGTAVMNNVLIELTYYPDIVPWRVKEKVFIFELAELE